MLKDHQKLFYTYQVSLEFICGRDHTQEWGVVDQWEHLLVSDTTCRELGSTHHYSSRADLKAHPHNSEPLVCFG